MKQDPLFRLLQSAAKAAREEPAAISNVLESRIISSWKRGEPDDDEPAVIRVFRWGFAVSMAAACIALVIGMQTNGTSVFEEVQATVSASTMSYYP